MKCVLSVAGKVMIGCGFFCVFKNIESATAIFGWIAAFIGLDILHMAQHYDPYQR